jgi:5-methyltetrahydropteroyltriglutamate--homocysteine methyltransferase
LVTEFALSLTGSHARAETTIQATQDWERGRVDTASLAAAFREDCDELVDLQRQSGADYISDGQLTTAWQDFLRPVTNGFKGLKKGAMYRWYNTNTFYYAPIVEGEISSDGHAIWKKLERRFAKTGKLRVAVPDPLTFSELAEDHFYGGKGKDALLFAYADALNAELKTLENRDVAYVQFSCPALVARFREEPVSKDRLGQLGEAIRAAKKGTSVRTGFHTFFGDASPYLPGIFDAIPTDDIGFDFSQTDPASLSATKKGIIAGVADARTTYLEGVDELGEKVDTIIKKTGSKRITLAPTSDLRYIPRVSADEKLRRLGALKEEFKGGER